MIDLSQDGIRDLEKLMFYAVSPGGLSSYLANPDSLKCLISRGFLVEVRSFVSDGETFYNYRATEAGQVAFSRQRL